jgi:predicted transglutaminase-like cysteine proteinase
MSIQVSQTLLGKVKYFLIDVLNKSYDEKLLSFSQRTSVLSLLFKKGDPLVLDNYRSISLLNVDLKLLSYVLAQRLKKVSEKIIQQVKTLDDFDKYILKYFFEGISTS